MLRYASRHEKHLPANFYNLKADLPELPPPPLNPATREPLNSSDLEAIFPKSFIAQEVSLERELAIPEKVREAYSVFRPTPLIQASKLESYLDTPARIFYKFEGVSPTGSHKTNTALMQAYLASQDGVTTLSTETGAGQWGTALSYAGALFGVKARVYMVRSSFRQKPGRRIMMQLFGGEVTESPSPTTDAGRKYYQENPDHPGSLGIAISEAVEVALKSPEVKYSLGSVLDTVMIHQSIIGLEAQSQCREIGFEPDLIVGCVGGGSNFAGLSFPFVRRNLKEKAATRYLAVEPEVCPSLTAGELTYDFGDSVGLTPLLYMYTLGKDFIPPAIHAGGLRYHGMSPLVSHLVKQGLVEAKAYPQDRVFEAAELFLRTEGILPAPESAHAIAAVIDEALLAKKTGQPVNILFNLSGHGFLDISAYDRKNK
ncbi:MAG TPA: TrpB-like pyridoxal phosphate-dependent enzyme [Candidatus Saccharicenans sp.]|nr:TrpB-like pyridoxal phosphate-dependent enzyme [Candidatus Saccharicenans sp.]HPU93190.1 TrpB-like pyridoxal phosphate-dependent enzyme [Candidatus Saccharicenans sp.]HQH61826.1 TrpB-like pyridoxal phosphate-dependent enzyme [Candidatus Saccharicenans sp.]HQM75003.1 TrpB-like pyridoxal phosphate-dependent enzyme [Candidatus Saccharicenans sp.]HUM34250.1 TrpB-like pyridoxal phosphate-dependent enzyme [Candidatus Saccharicenans sp.]